MKIASEKVKRVCAARRTGIGEALERAGVSRNAFYSLARRDSILPDSVLRLARALDVPVTDLLEPTPSKADRLIAHADLAARIAAESGRDADNIRHTLMLLDEPPLQRLRRSLQRGRQFNLR